MSVVDSDCSLEAATPIAIDATTAWEVRKGIRANDRLNITALMTSRKVLVLGSKAVARMLGNPQANYAQKRFGYSRRSAKGRSSIVALPEHDRLRGMGAEGPLSMIPNCRSRRTMLHEWPEPARGLSDARLAAGARWAKAKKG